MRANLSAGGMVVGGLCRRAFSMIEMVVVTLIITVLIVVALPAFSALIGVNAQAQAVEGVRSALTLARGAAVTSPSGRDTAAVFFFEPGGVVSVVACVRVGEFRDQSFESGSAVPVVREVFAPIVGPAVINLPRGFTVRGFVATGRLDDPSVSASSREWYRGERFGLTLNEGDWVFPETGFYKQNFDGGLSSGDDGMDRSTFMVRYEAGTGRPRRGAASTVLVLAPRPSSTGRQDAPWDAHRLDLAESLERTFQRIADDGAITEAERRQLIGTSSASRRSSDVVVAGPVTELAVMEEAALATGLGLRPDGFTGVLYRVFDDEPRNRRAAREFFLPGTDADDIGPFLAIPSGDVRFTPETFTRLQARWIEGWRIRDSQGVLITGEPTERSAETTAQVFGVNPSSGAMVELPLELPGGVQ